MKRFLFIIVVLIPLFLIKEKFNVPLSYKILLIPTRQFSSMVALGREMMTRGHVVHYLLNDAIKIFDPDLGEILTSRLDHVKLVRFRGLQKSATSKYDDITTDTLQHQTFDGDLKISDAECRQLLMHNEMLFSQLKNEQYNLAVVDGDLWTACYYLIPHRLGISWATYTETIDDWHWDIRLPWMPWFVPHPLIEQFTDKPGFTQRVQNMLYHMNGAYWKFQIKPADDILNEYRQYGSFNNLADLVKKSKLFISNQDVAIDCAKPTIPNLINAGGMTANRPSSQLSDDLEIFLASSEKGSIFVSFGYLSFTMPEATAKKFAAAFGRLKGYQVLWKLKNVNHVAIPRNVRITNKFLPQQGILAHSKTKLFITHCSSNSQFEAVYHKVPMLGFPLNVFQHNAKRIEDKGFGIVMDIHNFTTDELYTNILKILHDPSYKNRISLASVIFRSAPQRPAERAAYWIEHVIKFGSDHLQSVGSDLELYEYYMLDVAACGGVVLIAIGAVCFAKR